MPTSFWNCCPAPRGSRRVCRTASASGKRGIEERGPENTFAVVLIYGPLGLRQIVAGPGQGCCPRLAEHIVPVYVGSDGRPDRGPAAGGAGGGAVRALPVEEGLKGALAALRRGQGAFAAGKKGADRPGPVRANGCTPRRTRRTPRFGASLAANATGRRVQCVVLVRDDFWMAATRFHARPGDPTWLKAKNSACRRSFPAAPRRESAGRPLAGRFGGLARERHRGWQRTTSTFSSKRYRAWRREGKVICVRLALFADK